MTEKEFDKVCAKALKEIIDAYKHNNKCLRIGQVTFNVLYKTFKKYDFSYFHDVTGNTMVDHFYNDKNTIKFIKTTVNHFKPIFVK